MTTELDPELLALVGERLYVLTPAGLVITLAPGDDDAFAYPKTVLLRRGQSIEITEPILRGSLDRKGHSWLLASELNQHERHGHIRFAFEWPEGEDVIERGSVEAIWLGDRERALAWRTKSGAELGEALREIDRRLGRSGTISTTTRQDVRERERVESDALVQRRLVEQELRRQNEIGSRPLGGAA